MSNLRHFLSLLDLSPQELGALITRAGELKKLQREGTDHATLSRKVMAMIFEKSSTRTRVSFEAGMTQLGGSALFLSPESTQLGRGEPIEDTARVISSMVDIIMVRTFSHEGLKTLAAHSSVPVINALTDFNHPCQLLADMQAYIELRGDIAGKTVVWVGDGNNMCNSYINAARQWDFKLRIACPIGYDADPALLAANASRVDVIRDPMEAAENAHLITTDVWTSMGDEAESAQRMNDLSNYQVNSMLMQRADPSALFLHCLPAHRGEEVTANVIDGEQSGVWEQAENRLHAQKALIEFLLLGNT